MASKTNLGHTSRSSGILRLAYTPKTSHFGVPHYDVPIFFTENLGFYGLEGRFKVCRYIDALGLRGLRAAAPNPKLLRPNGLTHLPKTSDPLREVTSPHGQLSKLGPLSGYPK